MAPIGIVRNNESKAAKQPIESLIIWVVVSNMFYVHPLFGEDSHFDQYFSKGLKPPTSYVISRGKSMVLWSNNFDVR